MRAAWETYRQFGPFVRFWVAFAALYVLIMGLLLFYRAVT